ncbi:MAG: hypothetical protein HWE34_07495 [Methylocystaceae bacterium]|nr:hypothetical protein [Methylocystaceae bacterium]
MGAVLMLVVSMLVIGVAVHDSHRKIQWAQLISRGELIAETTAETIEYLLSVGAPLPLSHDVRRIVDMVNRDRAATKSVSIYDVKGKGLYSSDFSLIGEIGDGRILQVLQGKKVSQEHSLDVLRPIHSPYGEIVGVLVVQMEESYLAKVSDYTTLLFWLTGIGVVVFGGILSTALLYLTTQREREIVRQTVWCLECEMEETEETEEKKEIVPDRFFQFSQKVFKDFDNAQKKINELDKMA